MTDQFVTWSKAEGTDLERAFREFATTGTTAGVYWAEEVVTRPSTNTTAASNVAPSAIVADPNNTTTAVLAANATFTGTATDISNYNQLVVEIFGRPGVVAGDGVSAKGSFYFEFSPDGVNWDVSVPALVRDPSLVIPIPIINVHRFFRVKYINDGGTSAISALGLVDTAGTPTLQTVFRLTTYLYPWNTKELTRTLDQGIQGSDPVVLSRSVNMGRQPSGTYVNFPAGGPSLSNNTTVTLGAGGTFTGGWERVVGMVSVGLVVATTDASNGTDGIRLQFSDSTVSVRRMITRVFSTDDANNGSAYFTVPNQGDYFRVLYHNGSTAQTSFFLETRLNPTQVESAKGELTAQVAGTDLAQMVRAFPAAPNDGGVFDNITRGSSGGLRMSFNEAETEMPIKALDSWHTSGATITTAAGGQIVASPGLTHRKSISLKADPANSRTIKVGYSTAVATNGYPLSAGDSIDLELSTAISVYAISLTSPQDLWWAEVASST